MGHSASRVVVKADKIEKIEEEEENRRVVVHCQGGKVGNELKISTQDDLIKFVRRLSDSYF